FFFSSRRRHTRFSRDWSSDVCSSDLTWSDTTGKSFSSRGGATDGTNVFFSTHHGRIIYAFDAATRTVAWVKDLRTGATDSDLQRSEERRVGKAGRSRWRQYQ